jgi:hypothetical protein
MTVVKYVSAIICFGLGVGLVFAAVQSMYSSLGLGDNLGGPIVAGVGAMFLLVTYLLLRRKMNRPTNFDIRPRAKPLSDAAVRSNRWKAD